METDADFERMWQRDSRALTNPGRTLTKKN
jgi:hypothetical protein